MPIEFTKKFPKRTSGVYLIDSSNKKENALKWLKIEDVWGIGFKHGKRLRNIKINTAYDFINLEDNWVRKNMSVVGVRLKKELEGKSILDLEEVRSPKKQLQRQEVLKELSLIMKKLKKGYQHLLYVVLKN